MSEWRSIKEGDRYTCEHCRGEFIATTDDKQELSETRRLFGDVPEEDRARICDACFEEMMSWGRAQGHFPADDRTP